jgi:hypothetical protein
MKKWIAAMLGLPVFGLHAQTPINSFDDIQFWAGSGTNRAALVIQWPDAEFPTSIAWGYRWNGEATAQEMIFALAGVLTGGPAPSAGSDPRLEFDLLYYGAGLNDYFVNEIRFNQDGLGAPWSADLRIMPGYDGVDFNVLSFRYGTSLWSSATFTVSNFGPAGVPLLDGAWIGWIYADGTDEELTFEQPYAAPASVLPPLPKPTPSIHISNGAAVVSVPSQADFKYQLALTGELGGAWTNQTPVVNGTGATVSFTDMPPSGTNAQRFYRVVISR